MDLAMDHRVRRGKNLQVGDHLCFLHNTEREFRTLLGEFVRSGVIRKEKCVYIADEYLSDAARKRMFDTNLNIDACISLGQLKIVTWEELNPSVTSRPPEQMIGWLERQTADARAEGYLALRVLQEMTWSLRCVSGQKDLVEYERLLSGFVTAHPCITVCRYDIRRFAMSGLAALLRLHPLIILDGEIYLNRYYRQDHRKNGGSSPPNPFLF